MVKESEEPCGGGLEWRTDDGPDGTSKMLVPERTPFLVGLQAFVIGILFKIRSFFQKAWKLGANEPRKVVHCLKVGMALSFVSLFYYMRPLYDGVGGTAMWAIMTVVVVFEYTVGATLSKCVNRATGTFLARALGVGVHWIASQSGECFEPIILQGSVFILATAATFSRFIPSIIQPFDYGALIFILTFSLVSVSGYRAEKLFELARNRLSTIAIGVSICILTSMLVSPVWAGTELHNLVGSNMEKLADSLDGCVAEYFRDDAKYSNTQKEASEKISKGYKCLFNTKTTEESLANFARWEPLHGQFNFGHPWKEYLKIGASLRSCACCMEALKDALKKHFSRFCIRVSTASSSVLKELAIVLSSMTNSSNIDLMLEEMNSAVEGLRNTLESMSKQQQSFPPSTQSTKPAGDRSLDEIAGDDAGGPKIVPLMEIVPFVSLSLLLIEIAVRIEKVVEAVNGLAGKAEFKDENAKKNRNQEDANQNIGGEDEVDKMMMMTLQ